MDNLPLQNISPNKSFKGDLEQQANSLGLEKHVKHIFMQTQQTINSLNQELEDQRKLNDDMQWKLTELQQQKQNLSTKSKTIDIDLQECKQKVGNLLKTKNEYKTQITAMKKELQSINDDWENKRKELLHQLNLLKEEQLKLEDERNKEKVAFDQANKQYLLKIDSISHSINSTNDEIHKYEALIQKLKEKEKFSMETILSETAKFKEFLLTQTNDNCMNSSVNNSKVQLQ